MPIALRIALGHMLSRRRQTLVSLAGIILGVAFFIAVSSLMRGSEEDFIHRLIDNSPHITVSDEYRNPRVQPAATLFPDGAVQLRSVKPLTENRGIRGYKQKLAYLQTLPGVQVAPVLTGQVIIRFAGQDRGVALSGVVPDMMRNVSTIEQYLIEGTTLDDLMKDPNGIIIGKALAKRFQLHKGDRVSVAAPNGTVKIMKVIGLFKTGTDQIDEGTAYALLKKVQVLMDKPNIANRLILRLNNQNDALRLAAEIEDHLGYKSLSWQEASADIMNLLKVRNIIMYSVVSAILVVASFGIYNVISTIVMEKTKDIAIMKSMGFHARDIRRIFLIEGLIMGALGSLAGCLLGLGLLGVMGSIDLKFPMSDDISHLPLYIGLDQFALAIAFAMLSATGAAWLPARKAGRVHPVAILRGAA